ncbi:MAG: histidine kinase, partial [Pseudomonadota bacterium]|nr:histidine kinase [Pseudomonadota bacterium]
MTCKIPDTRQSRRDLRRASRWIVGLFWLLQFIELSLLSLIEGRDVALKSLEPRLLVLVAGIVLMLGFVEIVARLDRRPFRVRLVLTLGWAFLVCLVLVTINFAVFYVAFSKSNVPFDPIEYAYVAFLWSWFCLSVAGTLLALSYNIEVRDREQRLAAMEAVANQAQLAALRYQLNPHFLFNTLNSIASLVARRDNEGAERMVENLADFLRATLELDPVEDITLAREVDLQRMYLSIEEQRFPDRLITRFDIPRDLARARVPALITQPLVENAIRHAVARSTEPVTVRMTASAQGDMLVIVVEDDAQSHSAAAAAGTGVGIG